MAENQFAPPLTEEHLRQLNEGLAAAREGLRQCELAKRAGIDCGDAEKTLNDQVDRILRIKQVYFPGR